MLRISLLRSVAFLQGLKLNIANAHSGQVGGLESRPKEDQLMELERFIVNDLNNLIF